MRTMTKLLWVGALVVIAACSSKSAKGGLAVSTHAGGAASTATSAGLDLGNGITISRIRMAVSRISVEGGDAGANGCTPTMSATESEGGGHGGGGGHDGGGMDPSGVGSEAGDDHECELSFGPFDVDLAGSALTGSVAFAFDVPIPDGTYEEIAIKVNTVPAEKAGMNPVLLDLAAAHASILVDGFVQEVGTTTQTPFGFSTPMEVKQKREGKITIGEGANVTLDFDPSGWFGGTGDARLDPTSPSSRGAIEANIRASIRILDDDDHDGVDDHEGGSPGHD